ncbi:MAG TPA: hypothetical protein PLG20_01705 [Candidatus Syntrophosphaera sp.]|jgi:hypothetical protein|nr:hypothetical protein [Candidatus Syntrophosphaera sp.]
MQLRFVKDLAVGLIIIFLLAYVIRLATVNEKNKQIRAKSIYTNESVSDTLKTRIMAIESSIQDRQNFVFAISKDPLRQGNIIKDRFDRTKEWLEMLRNTFRATGTYLDEQSGRRLVTFEYQDRILSGGVGDVVEGRRITWIGDKTVGIYFGGPQTLEIQSRPVMPDFSKEDTKKTVINDNY